MTVNLAKKMHEDLVTQWTILEVYFVRNENQAHKRQNWQENLRKMP